MKPRSIIALIVAAVLILGGIITCLVASSVADSDSVMLFPEADADGNLVYKMDLHNTTKITVNTADADVTIVGGAEKSVIEVINFNANYYKLSESNGSLTFGQVDDFLSMFKFWDNGFSFKGMRYLLRFGDDTAGDKKIVIRLADTDDIKLVNITSDAGNISISDCGFAADYTLRADSGKVDINGIDDSRSFNISGKETDLHITNCKTDTMKVNADMLSSEFSEVDCKSCVVNMTDGSFNFGDSTAESLAVTTGDGEVSLSPYGCAEGTITGGSGKVKLDFEDTDSLAASVSTKTGKISVNGEFVEGFSKNSPEPKHRVTVITDDGDVYITHP